MYAHVGFGAEAVDYRQAWETQRAVHGRRVLGEIPDCCLLLEHSPVYTAGKRTAVSDRPFGDPGAPVIDVDRGGKITWHGPGQLTAYPIVKLREPMDVVAYVRALEEAMIGVCAEFGLEAIRVEGRSGAWLPASAALPERKVGAIGARVARGVTMHGLALNCDCDLSWYDRIVPCGIKDAGRDFAHGRDGHPGLGVRRDAAARAAPDHGPGVPHLVADPQRHAAARLGRLRRCPCAARFLLALRASCCYPPRSTRWRCANCAFGLTLAGPKAHLARWGGGGGGMGREPGGGWGGSQSGRGALGGRRT